jgi:hypothetical protein
MSTSNVLSLLAYKVKPRVFDISTGLRQISIRDQIIRGYLLIRDLVDGGQLAAGDEILVVGAGVAGVSVAMAASDRGIRVLLVDAADAPLSLQKGVTTRFVGPHLYEWPLSLHDNQWFPVRGGLLSLWTTRWNLPRFNSPSPIDADRFRTDCLLGLTQAMRTPGLITVGVLVQTGPLRAEIRRAVKRAGARRGLGMLTLHATPWPPAGGPTTLHCSPAFIVLAAGNGDERTQVTGASGSTLSGTKFWQADALLAKHAGKQHAPNALVVGGGDGALQDTLRLLCGTATPLDFLHAVKPAHAAIRRAIGHLTDVEQQHRLCEIWNGEPAAQARELAALHAAVAHLARTVARRSGVAAAVLQALRPDVGRVTLAVREQHFGKAYLLNRFLVLLIDACQRVSGASLSSGRAHLHLLFDATFQRQLAQGRYEFLVAGKRIPVSAAVVVVRAGVTGIPGRQRIIGLSHRDSRIREALAAIPMPLAPPT